MPEPVPKAFLKVLSDLTAWFADAQVSAIVVGGVAASILGRLAYEEDAIARGRLLAARKPKS